MNALTAAKKLQALHAQGWSGQAIARETGIPQPTVSRLMSGKHLQPKEPTVRAIDSLYDRIFNDSRPAA